MLFGDAAAERFDRGLAVDRVDESDGCEELLEELLAELLEGKLERVPLLESLGWVRPQSVFPLEAAFAESWQ